MGELWLTVRKKGAVLTALLLLCGCSTVSGWLGGDDEPQEMAEAPLIDAPQAPQSSIQQQLDEKDRALVEQGMRIAAAERQLQMMQEQNSALKAELEAAREDASTSAAMADQANESQIAAAANAINSAADTPDVPRPTAPDGGYGLHLTSYENRDNIEPGIAALTRQIPVLLEGRPLKITTVTVGGRNFNRLIIGQFDSETDARAECRQALLLVSYCEVVAFSGQDY